MATTNDGERIRRLRRKLGLRQDQFWNRVGVTQSAGSRYETSSRKLPAPLKMLIELAYGNKAQRALKQLRA